MESTLVQSNTRETQPWTRGFRSVTIGTSLVALALGIGQVHVSSLGAMLLLFALIFLSRSIPVAISREKPITFTAAFVFAASLLLNGVSAGLAALLACSLYARFVQRSGRTYGIFLGAQYALAAMASYQMFHLLTGTTTVSAQPSLQELCIVNLAAALFALVNATLVGLGNLGTRYARRRYAEPVIRAQSLAYAVSFPFAVLMVFAYRSLGAASLPILAAFLLVCSHTVRVTVENRLLARQLWAVEALGRTCASGVRAEMPLQRFLTLARDLVAFDRAVLWLTEESQSVLAPRAVYPEGSPLPDPCEADPDTLVGRMSARSKALLISDASRDPRQPTGTPPCAWMLYPIVLHGRSIGVAQFMRSVNRPFTRTEEQRLAALVPQAAVAFESVRVRYLMHRYADMATTDGLTGLWNHRRSQELLREELKRAGRYHRAVTVLMLDVDAFKQFNDTYGHPQGDTLLRSIARILRSSVRNVDSVGRYGGEEFIIILPETNRNEACILAERIRSAVESEQFSASEGRTVHKTISIGVASFPEDATEAAELIQHADDALYRAKRMGKNRVLTA